MNRQYVGSRCYSIQVMVSGLWVWELNWKTCNLLPLAPSFSSVQNSFGITRYWISFLWQIEVELWNNKYHIRLHWNMDQSFFCHYYVCLYRYKFASCDFSVIISSSFCWLVILELGSHACCWGLRYGSCVIHMVWIHNSACYLWNLLILSDIKLSHITL
jgi:hypothetical protein